MKICLLLETEEQVELLCDQAVALEVVDDLSLIYLGDCGAFVSSFAVFEHLLVRATDR